MSGWPASQVQRPAGLLLAVRSGARLPVSVAQFAPLPLAAPPQDYPNKAPVVKFRTRMFHPNSEPWQRKLGSHSFAGS